MKKTLLTNDAESVLLEIYEHYQVKRKAGKTHTEACDFSFPLPGDGFITGFFAIDDELETARMIEVHGSTSYTLTRIGIEYSRNIKLSDFAYEKAESAKKDAHFAKIIAILSLIMSAFAIIAQLLNK